MNEEKKFYLVLVTHHDSGKLSIKGKVVSPDRSVCEARLAKLVAHAKACHQVPADYRIVDQEGLQLLRVEITKNIAKRVKAGAKKAAATRERNKAKGKKPEKPTFVLCPTCKSRSKKLYSEFGGLQTRECKNGHKFEHDKWIADRPLMALGAVLAGVRVTRPIR
jgi:hypothetical protein